MYLQYFEQDDPELYTSMVCYLEENSVEGLDLTFSEDVYECGKLVKVLTEGEGGQQILKFKKNKNLKNKNFKNLNFCFFGRRMCITHKQKFDQSR